MCEIAENDGVYETLFKVSHFLRIILGLLRSQWSHFIQKVSLCFQRQLQFPLNDKRYCAHVAENNKPPCIMRAEQMPGMGGREISTPRLCVTDENWVHQKDLRVKRIKKLTFRALPVLCPRASRVKSP